MLMLVHVSILDIRYREVDTKIWLFYSPLALFLIYDIRFLDIFLFLYSFIVTILILYFFYRLSFMGGADLFVMIILGLADSSVHPLFYSLFSIMGMEPLIIMLFASLIIFISAIVNFIRYYRYTTGLPMSKRIILAISGRRMKVKDFINSKFLFPLSEIDDNGNENLRTSFSVEEDDKEWRDRYAKLVANGIVSEDKMVWVAYGIPVLPFILFGYIISLIVGIPI